MDSARIMIRNSVAAEAFFLCEILILPIVPASKLLYDQIIIHDKTVHWRFQEILNCLSWCFNNRLSFKIETGIENTSDAGFSVVCFYELIIPTINWRHCLNTTGIVFMNNCSKIFTFVFSHLKTEIHKWRIMLFFRNFKKFMNSFLKCRSRKWTKLFPSFDDIHFCFHTSWICARKN